MNKCPATELTTIPTKGIVYKVNGRLPWESMDKYILKAGEEVTVTRWELLSEEDKESLIGVPYAKVELFPGMDEWNANRYEAKLIKKGYKTERLVRNNGVIVVIGS